MTLTELYLKNKYRTDKYDLGYVSDMYDDLFTSYKEIKINFLEIGVLDGGSIRMWRDYFLPETEIHTLDTVYCEDIENLQNVFQHIRNAYNEKGLSTFDDNFFDIIVDDGPHTFESMEFLITGYHSKLKPGGLMVVEDIMDLIWTPRLIEVAENVGYTQIKRVEMAGHQKAEHLSHWSSGLDVLTLIK